MAEIDGPAIDESTLNLDNSGNCPSTSNMVQKEGTLKRQASIGNDTSPLKKKKSAEELASTSRGRNLAMKKHLKKSRKKQNTQEKKVIPHEALLEHRDKVLERLRVLGEREMLGDKAEEKALKKEEKLRDALMSTERALENGGVYENEEDEKLVAALSINLPDWPCLDTYVQDFARDRLYEHREKGIAMTTSELVDIINKVKSSEPSIGLPSLKDEMNMERLLVAINCKIGEAVHERTFEHLMENLGEYPNVQHDAPDTVPDTAFSHPRALLKVKQECGDAEREELNELVGRVIRACVETEGVQEKDIITLEEEDEDKEADEDEFSDMVDDDVGQEEEEEQPMKNEEDEDLKLLNALNDYPGVDENNSIVELPEDNDTEVAEQSMHNESVDDNAKEEKEGPDSRDEKEIMEGGTSTNSPTLERDERMKEIEKIDDVKQEDTRMDSDSPGEATETIGASNKATTGDKTEKKVIVVANTIVLDDDEEEERKGEGEGEEVVAIERNEKTTKKEEDEQEWVYAEDMKIVPPAPPTLTATEAWRAKVQEIQKWVNKLTDVAVEEEVITVDDSIDDEEDKDDEIVCIQDDFEMDSVSHSGLMIRQMKGEAVAEGETPPSIPPHIPPHRHKSEKDEDVEVIELD